MTNQPARQHAMHSVTSVRHRIRSARITCYDDLDVFGCRNYRYQPIRIIILREYWRGLAGCHQLIQRAASPDEVGP